MINKPSPFMYTVVLFIIEYRQGSDQSQLHSKLSMVEPNDTWGVHDTVEKARLRIVSVNHSCYAIY
jgi:hypothetical protein